MWIAAALPSALAAATLEERLAQIGPAARARMQPSFASSGLAYPPQRVLLLGLKSERRLEVYAGGASGPLRRLRVYLVHAASGTLGPKLREGDRQVPEGFYRVAGLNPNSQYHVALRLDYPNAADRARARAEGRENLGGDIMIHGSNVSIGCLAMGDEVAEELFVLAADVSLERVRVVLSPIDFRRREPPSDRQAPWVLSLYGEIRRELATLPRR